MQHETRTIDLEALIAAEYAALRSHIEERLVPLLVERALLQASSPSRQAPVSAGATHQPDPEAELAACPEPPKARPHTAQLIVDALWDAPGHRMHGRELTRVIIDAGYTRDAAEKNKTRLKKLGVLIKETGTGFWALAPRFLEPGAEIPAYGTLRTDDARGTTGGQAMLEALASAGATGLAGDDLLRAAERRGVSPSRAVYVRARLRAERHIDCDMGPGAHWWIAGAGPERAGASASPPGSRSRTPPGL